MVPLLCFMLLAVGFVMGAVVASFWFNTEAQKAKNEWRQKRKELEIQIFQLKKQLDAQQRTPVSVKKGEVLCESRMEAAVSSRKQDHTERKRVPRITAASVPEKPRIPQSTPVPAGNALEQVYAEFAACESLSVDFQPSFADSLLFRPGSGYIRNQKDELLPDRDSIENINTTAGYTMEGLFRIFDVIYKGREYSFPQIQAGAMGHDYVRIQSVVACAKVRKSGMEDIYVLERKGKLEVTDA